MAEQPVPDANPAAANIRAIVELERKTLEDEGWANRVSFRIGQFAGHLQFVVFHVLGFAVWAAWNAFGPRSWRFDPYPWSLLNFIVSSECLLIATFVLIAQNRMSRQSDHREHLDLQVDLLAEQEMTMMLRLLRKISDRLGIESESEDAERTQQLTEQTNVYELMESIKRELPEEPPP